MLPRLEYDRGAPRRIGFAIILALLLAAAATWWFGPSQRQHRRNSALWEACTKGDLQAAQDALAAGAEPNTRDKYGITPLMYAARGDRPDMANPPATDHPAIVQLLIKSGAQRQQLDQLGLRRLVLGRTLRACAGGKGPHRQRSQRQRPRQHWRDRREMGHHQSSRVTAQLWSGHRAAESRRGEGMICCYGTAQAPNAVSETVSDTF
jgi:hypothetical protein